jgi:undecaprenyl diphosphate synthase
MNRKTEIPAHVGIIMDGNGRWAKKRFLPRVLGHREGAKVVVKITEYASNVGVGYLSLFAFSTENWLRPPDEVSTLMDLLDDYVESQITSIIKNNIRFVVSGDISRIRRSTRERLEKMIETSKNHTGMVLNIALNYGGKDEIINAAVKMAEDYKKGIITSEQFGERFSRYLYNPDIPDIDLLIRTSGEYRISNFMLWRIAYSELYFTKVLWPDFNENDFWDAIIEYNKRIRRFGKTDEQISNK